MYYFSGTSKKYIDAQQFCAKVNAYLVEFYNLMQYREVRRMMMMGESHTDTKEMYTLHSGAASFWY